ncbi:putative WD repeat-containing protein 19 [Monocercomonoides exilis]|uniref:putative WD repeat-containing protein 19 n=1 Tax=Monocercomonoides exilis TaxID=2049356 RepID=UPI00355A4A29|nr:putative WD repeat-containing protein 19 [Monocercomonoides exilis]|eukprot:MONOS_10317.1-p1 / transcript=MONOS_10317.1 / gene=MONOS_10317 / organism=Monocercomonoides_exilis_PA203 / gene_product=WD repeat-containing protein 19 / transcript_product=WD repeat-containing protein 19 / location=Mono_scaffold00464:12783-18416(-) / protein_length=1812 / sequence_SO=supercontig / SO=protein_coding / is_pseudo=false
MKNLFTIPSSVNGRGGKILMSWHPMSIYIAVCGSNCVVHLFHRSGNEIASFTLPSACLQIDWDKDGEYLGVLPSSSTSIILYEASTKEQIKIDCGSVASFMCWSKNGPFLAIGTENGNLIIYNKILHRKNIIRGVFTKRIRCGCWNSRNLLALGSDEHRICVVNSEGKSVKTFMRDNGTEEMEWGDVMSTGATQGDVKEQSLVAVDPKGMICIYFKLEQEIIIELTQTFGKLNSVRWFGNGYLYIAYESGTILVVSTHPSEISKVIRRLTLFNQRLVGFALPPPSRPGMIALAGDTSIKFLSPDTFQDMPSERIPFGTGFGAPTGVSWSPDGQIVAAAASEGSLLTFIANFPTLHATYSNLLAYRSSLREISVVDVAEWGSGTTPTDALVIPVEPEPTMLCVGPGHIAVAMNNHAWIYRFFAKEEKSFLVFDRDYSGSIKQMCINATHFAVLIDSRAYVIELAQNTQNSAAPSASATPSPSPPSPLSPPSSSRQSSSSSSSTSNASQYRLVEKGLRVFPERGETADVTAVALCADFLIYTTSSGNIVYHSLLDWGEINNYRCPTGIRSITPNTIGTRVVCFDVDSKGFVYSPITDATLPLPSGTPFAETVLWDQSDAGVFVVKTASRQEVTTIVCSPDMFGGARVVSAGVTTVPPYMNVVAIHSGYIHFQSPSGELFRTQLQSHNHLILAASAASASEISHDVALRCFEQCMALFRLKDAWSVLLKMHDRQAMERFAQVALHLFDIPYATRAYRILGDVSMVCFLLRLSNCDDKNLLSGYIALLHGDTDQAQRFFLNSTNPVAALDMRCDTLQWEQALQLARQLAPERIPFISAEYAQQLEVRGDFTKASQLYKNGLTGGANPTHDALCRGGIARTAIRTGEVRKGVEMAVSLGSSGICLECAGILESMKLTDDAAFLFEKGGMIEKAVELYLSTRNLRAVQPLMKQIKTPRLHLRFGREMENERRYEEAVAAYLVAGDLGSVARLYIATNNLPAAFDLVRNSRSAEAARLLSAHCIKEEMFGEAIEFLVVAKCFREATDVANEHNCMDSLVEALIHADEDFIARREEKKKEEEEAKEKRREEKEKRRRKREMLLKRGIVPENADADLQDEDESDEEDDDEQDGSGRRSKNWKQRRMEQLRRKRGKDEDEQDAFVPPEEYSKAAKFYEAKGDISKAAELFARAGQFHRSVKYHLQVASRESIVSMIEIVGKAKSNLLDAMVESFLLNPVIKTKNEDGNMTTQKAPVLPIDLFRFYMAIGNMKQAVHSALSVSAKEMDNKNYKAARDFLFHTETELRSKAVAVPQSLSRMLNLIHSYFQAKQWVNRKNDFLAARLLIRCAKNISKFSSFAVPILTMTVMECHRAGLKKSAFEYASLLMQPQYHEQIDEKRKKPIEQIVLKSKSPVDCPEPFTPCPVCATHIPESCLLCSTCQSQIPMCIVSGLHMVRSDYCECPSCHYPFLLSAAHAYFNGENGCPLCDASIVPEHLCLVTEPTIPFGPANRSPFGQPSDEEEMDEAGEAGMMGEGGEDGGGGGGGSGSEGDSAPKKPEPVRLSHSQRSDTNSPLVAYPTALKRPISQHPETIEESVDNTMSAGEMPLFNALQSPSADVVQNESQDLLKKREKSPSTSSLITLVEGKDVSVAPSSSPAPSDHSPYPQQQQTQPQQQPQQMAPPQIAPPILIQPPQVVGEGISPSEAGEDYGAEGDGEWEGEEEGEGEEEYYEEEEQQQGDLEQEDYQQSPQIQIITSQPQGMIQVLSPHDAGEQTFEEGDNEEYEEGEEEYEGEDDGSGGMISPDDPLAALVAANGKIDGIEI